MKGISESDLRNLWAMISLFALNPCLFEGGVLVADDSANPQRLTALLDKILDNPVLITNFANGAWESKVHSSKNTLPNRVNIFTLIDLLVKRNRFVRKALVGTSVPSSLFEWFEEAILLQAQQKVDMIVALGRIIDQCDSILPNTVSDLQSFRDHDCWDNINVVRSVERTLEAFETYTEALIVNSKKIALIDPYIYKRHDDLRFMNVIDVIGRMKLSQHNSTPLELFEINTLHSHQPKGGDYSWLTKSVGRYIHEELTNEGIVKLRLWEKREGGREFHNRFILTDQFGVVCPWGLDVGEDPYPDDAVNKDEWSIMGYELLVERNKDYRRNTSPFNLVKEFDL